MADLKSVRRLAVLFLVLILFAGVSRAGPPDYRPTVVEAMLLPKFCWKQFLGEKFSSPQYSIPRKTCGPFVNHYCPGLVDLNRANRVISNEAKKRADLQRAKVNTLYTLRGIKKFPHCPIRGHVETTLRVINDQLNAVY